MQDVFKLAKGFAIDALRIAYEVKGLSGVLVERFQ